MRIAIPSNFPGGLNAKISDHFGDCNIFTILEVDPENHNYENLKVTILENKDHLNCGIPILRLKNAGVDIIIVKKIGRRPLEILKSEKIPLYAGKGTVLEVIEDFCENRLQSPTQSNICREKIQPST